MMEDGVIEESRSGWGASVVFVKRKNGSLRFFVDHRKLNALTSPDAYPMPRVDEMLDQLGLGEGVLVGSHRRGRLGTDKFHHTFQALSV